MGNDEKYRKLIENLLHSKSTVNESRIKYNEKHPERMLKKLEEDLRDRKHSLGDNPAFPEGDERNFEESLISDRYYDVLKNVKKVLDIDSIDNQSILSQQLPLVKDCMKLEKDNIKELEELAIKMIREEYDIPEDYVEIRAELVDKISLAGTKKNPKPESTDNVFNNHEDIVAANKEVYKRRFINAMIQGASMKNNKMFHLMEPELTDLNPKFPNLYAKTMALADYSYYIVDNMHDQVPGGIVKVELPKKEGDKAIIHAQALIFPVLVHELTKGAMELLSAHGLPEDSDVRKFVTSKADFLAAEPWDMRLGPAIWERFTKNFFTEDYKLKHHVFAELISKPVDEFNNSMKEILAGTNRGKEIVNEILDDVKKEIKKDDFDTSMNERREEESKKIYLTPDDLKRIDLSDFGL